MLTLCSFLQRVFAFVKSLTVKVMKRDYRNKAVIMVSGVILMAAAFTSSGFDGGGRNVAEAFAEVPSDGGGLPEEESEEIETITEADIQTNLADSRQEGQQLVGQSLLKDVQRQEEQQKEARRELNQLKQAIRQNDEAREKAAEEARINAEEEAQQKEKEEAVQKEEEEKLRKEAEEAGKVQGLVNYSDEDYQILLKIVQAEAGVCDQKGKILVADVILNRVRSSEFPNSIEAVVFQRGQFSPVRDGSLYSCRVTDETVECVNRALAGEDYSQGALYFMNRSGARSRAVRWFDSRLTFLFQHDGHEFFK